MLKLILKYIFHYFKISYLHKTINNNFQKQELFINFFSWPNIPAPKTDEDPIPVCGSSLESSSKHSTVNIAFNPDILDKYGKNATNELEREMLINLGFQFIESQNKVKIQTNKFKILEETHFGDLKECIEKLTKKVSSENKMHEIMLPNDELKNIPQSVLNKLANMNVKSEVDTKSNKKSEVKKSLIEEMEKDSSKTPKYEANLKSSREDSSKISYDLKIDLIGLNSMSECQLDIDQSHLILNTTNKAYSELKISLDDLKKNYEIQVENIEAKFVKKTSALKIKIPLLVKEKDN